MKDSAGAFHLKKLSNAGITHVHLLPAYQFAGVDDEKENWKSVGKGIYELRHCKTTSPFHLNFKYKGTFPIDVDANRNMMYELCVYTLMFQKQNVVVLCKLN